MLSLISAMSFSMFEMKSTIKLIILSLSQFQRCSFVIRKLMSYPLIGFLLRISNRSARIDMNLLNFSQMCSSVSSFFFKAKLTRTEFMEAQIRQCYFFDLARTKGLMTRGLVYLSYPDISISGLVVFQLISEGRGLRQSTCSSVAVIACKYNQIFIYMLKPDFTSVDSCLLDTQSSLLEKLRRQLQYYLADANLTNDFYLRERLAESKGGFLSIDLFLGFNKVKELLESVQNLEDQRQMVRSCVKGSGLLKLNRSGLKLKRVRSFRPEDQEEVKCKTLYLEGFGRHLNKLTFLKFLNRFGKIVRLYVPSFAKGDNKGFAFATFADLQACEQAYAELRGLVCQELFSEQETKRSMRVLRRSEWEQQKMQFKRLLREGQEFPGTV